MAGTEVGDDTSARIVAAARRLYVERGVAGTSLADVAREVGVTKAAVAYHFHPKETLLVAVLQEAATDVMALLAAPAPRTRGQREAFLLAYTDLLVTHRELIPILAGGSGAIGGSAPMPMVEVLRDEVLRRLVPPRARPADTARVWAALGSVHVGLLRTLDLPTEAVQPTVRAAAVAAYRS